MALGIRAILVATFLCASGVPLAVFWLWGVMVPRPLAELEEAAARINRDSYLVLFAGLMLSTLIAWWVSSRIARRVNRVEGATMRVVGGDHRVRVEDSRSLLRIRELSNLSDGFNRMATEIQEAGAVKVARAELEVANQMLRNEIAERDSAELARTESENRFRDLFENGPIAIREEDFSQVKIEIDALRIEDHETFADYLDQHPNFVKKCADHIVVIDANLSAVKLHNLDEKAELLGGFRKNLNDKALETLKHILVAVHRGQTHLEFETTVIPATGPSRVVEACWSVAAGYEKTYARILLTSVDITERRQVEERLKQAQKMEAVGQLTGGVAHDFNNLLAVIGGNADLLADEAGSNPKLTTPIIHAVKRGAELTQRLLAFSRLQPLRPQVIVLRELVSGMSDLLTRTLGETIELRISAPRDLWKASADPGQVENALLNLTINARDAMPNGGKLTIECADVRLDEAYVAAHSEAEVGDYVVLSVSDDGNGMTSRTKAHAFEPFFTTKEVGEGSGLGLSMVYGFAKQTGGHATIYSELLKGTTVKIYLPRAEATAHNGKAVRTKSSIPNGQGEVVLVIEDDPQVCALAVLMLEKLGYRAIDVPNAAKAQKFLAEGMYVDLVLSDVVLPGGISGPEFAKDVRKIFPHIKIIFMSGYPREAATRSGFLESDDVLLNKPFERRELAEALRVALG